MGRRILPDLDQMKAGKAIKIPVKELPQSKEKARSALNRAIRKDGRNVATASDGDYQYVWNVQTAQDQSCLTSLACGSLGGVLSVHISLNSSLNQLRRL